MTELSEAAAQSPAPPTPVPAAARRDAAASGLRYVTPDSPGIQRRRAGSGFGYLDVDGCPIRGEQELARIRVLAIPPAWTDVWICPRADGHLQAIGRDARGRRQYRYHAAFRARRDDGKFARLIRFGERLPRVRRRVRADLRRPGLPKDKVLAAVVSLLEATRLRVGNAEYVRLNRSFGVSTLRNRHATVTATTLSLRFRGKGGRTEERRLVDRRLATVVRRCQELPGQDLFQYLDDEGAPRGISSEDVNAYLRDAAGSEELSAKDFRTWSATMVAFRALRDGSWEAAMAEGRSRGRVNPIVEALRLTAEEIGDTLAVTRNSYVHPGVLAAYEEGAVTGSAPARSRSLGAELVRGDELELLALLRKSGRGQRRRDAQRRTQAGSRTGSSNRTRAATPRQTAGAARTSQVAKARVADRSTRPAP